jgi:hypothetical protein
MSIRLDAAERRVFAIVFAAGEIRGAERRDFALPEGTILPGTIVRKLIRKGLLSVHQLGNGTKLAIIRPSIGAAAKVDTSRRVAAA